MLSVAVVMALGLSLLGVLFTNVASATPAPKVILPAIPGWYDGKMVTYIQADASDRSVAAAQGVNYVPQLEYAIAAGAVDDIYVVTNFNQANVIPSAPIPAGSGNLNSPPYTPLWQVNLVTWNSGTTPYTLTSEAAVLAANSAGLLTIVKTDIVVNCPVIYTPQGGEMPASTVVPPPK